MTQSAEYFLAGFFGLTWAQNATLMRIIEKNQYNNTLAGYYQCNNSNTARSRQGTAAAQRWAGIYLEDAVERFNELTPGFKWNATFVSYAQELCAYETVGFGYSSFCGLFTLDEWKGFEYLIDIMFSGNNAFQSPTGRAVGIGYVQEIL